MGRFDTSFIIQNKNDSIFNQIIIFIWKTNGQAFPHPLGERPCWHFFPRWPGADTGRLRGVHNWEIELYLW